MCLDDWQTVAEIAQAVFTILAILVAGVWTYRLYRQKRQRYPRAAVAHTVLWEQIGQQALVRAVVRVENIGEVLLRLDRSELILQQVLPLTKVLQEKVDTGGELPEAIDSCEFEWEALAQKPCNWSTEPREVEPQEADEFHFDFLIPSSVERVQLYSYFRNVRKNEQWWSRLRTWAVAKRSGTPPARKEIGWNTTTLHNLSKQRKRGEHAEENSEQEG